MSDELESATPAQVEQTEQVQEKVEQVSTEATAEQSQEQVIESPEDKAKKEPWFQKRIGELTREKYEAKRQAEASANEAAQYREYVARLQQGEQAQQPAADVQTLVKQEATRLLAERSFNETCNKVYAAGKAEFPNFDESVANLQLVGVSRDFLELATSSDAGAKLLHHLGANLEEAERIASLSPVQMARELTRLEFKLGQPAPAKPVSNAPAPISPIGGTQGGSKSPSEMTDNEFAKWRKSQIAARG
jgi:hypothetical protein